MTRSNSEILSRGRLVISSSSTSSPKEISKRANFTFSYLAPLTLEEFVKRDHKYSTTLVCLHQTPSNSESYRHLLQKLTLCAPHVFGNLARVDPARVVLLVGAYDVGLLLAVRVYRHPLAVLPFTRARSQTHGLLQSNTLPAN